MKAFILIISSFVLLFFSGCGGSSQVKVASKTLIAKKYPEKVSKKQMNSTINLGENIFYLNKQALEATMKNEIQDFLRKSLLEEMLVKAKFLQKDENNITFNKYSDLIKDINGLKLKNDTFSNDTEIMFTGRYKDEGNNKRGSIYFVAIYDKKTSLFKSLAFSTTGDAFFSKDLSTIGFYTSKKIKILKIENKKVASITPPKRTFFTNLYMDVRLSKSGKYLAITEFNKDSKENSMLVYHLDKKISLVSRIPSLQEKYIYPKYEFSDNEKFLIYVYIFNKRLRISHDTNFKIYDIEKNIVVDSFGHTVSSRNDLYSFRYTNLSSHREYFLAYDSIEFSKNKNRPRTDKVYMYNTSSRKLKSCDLNSVSADSMFLSSNDRVLHVTRTLDYEIIRKDYLLEKDKCIFFKEISFKKDKFLPVKISELEIDAIQKALKIKELHKAGFEKRADVNLRELIVEHQHDIYKNNFRFLMNNGFHKANLYALAYQRYIKEGKTLENSWLNGVIKNYISEESAKGLKRHVKLMIDKYKELIGTNPKQEEKSRLAIYEAIYLLEIGKDDEAYDKLFTVETFSKSDIEFIKAYTFNNMALYKDPKKLSAITGIDIKHFSKLPSYQNNKEVSGYDLNGNLIKVGKKTQRFVPVQKAVTPKQDAIQLLD